MLFVSQVARWQMWANRSPALGPKVQRVAVVAFLIDGHFAYRNPRLDGGISRSPAPFGDLKRQSMPEERPAIQEPPTGEPGGPGGPGELPGQTKPNREPYIMQVVCYRSIKCKLWESCQAAGSGPFGTPLYVAYIYIPMLVPTCLLPYNLRYL